MSSVYRFWTPAVITVVGGTVVTPGVVTVVATVPTPTVLAESVVTPAAVATVSTVPTPTILAASVVTPNVVPLSFTVPTPTIDVAPTVAPDAVVVVAAVPTPSVLAAANVTPNVVALLFTVSTPTIFVAAPVFVSPDVVEAFLSVPEVTLVNWHHSLVAGYDNSRFFRLSADQFILVTGLPRSTAKGHRTTEGWAPASGIFALPIRRRTQAMNDVKAVWAANKAADDATLLSLINAALTAAGYVRPNRSAIT